MKIKAFSVLAGLLLVVGACGSERLSVEEYFQQVDRILEDNAMRVETIADDFTDRFEDASEQETVAATRDFLADSAQVLSDFTAALDDINAPDDVEDAHDAMVAAFTELTRIFGGLAEREIESFPDVETVFAELGSPELEAATQLVIETCFALEQVAADNGIEASLECEFDEG